MTEQIRVVERYSASILNKLGEGDSVLGVLRDPGVNYSHFGAIRRARRAQLKFIPKATQARLLVCNISRRRNRPPRFRHFKHRMAELFVRKLAVNFPASALIEQNGPSIGLDHAKVKCVTSTTAYLKFRMCE